MDEKGCSVEILHSLDCFVVFEEVAHYSDVDFEFIFVGDCPGMLVLSFT